MKFITLLAPVVAAASFFTAPAQANQSDYQTCLKLRAELNALEAGLGDKSTNCGLVQNHKTPQERIKALGGRTALIRKCEALNKPSLKDPRSYRYDKANVVARKDSFAVQVHYRAKNSFNATVPGNFSCSFKG